MLVIVVVVQYLERHGGGDGGVDRNKNKKFLLESKHPSVVEDSKLDQISVNVTKFQRTHDCWRAKNGDRGT